MSVYWRLVAFFFWLRSVRTTMLYTLPLVLGAGQVAQGRGAVYVTANIIACHYMMRLARRVRGLS